MRLKSEGMSFRLFFMPKIGCERGVLPEFRRLIRGILTPMKSFLTSAGFLAFAGLVAKVIGAVYKVPLVAVLGAEGIGVYQLVFPVYTTLLTLSSGGIPQAVSRSTARALASGNVRDANRILRLSVLSLSAIGLIGSIIMAACGNLIAGAQGNLSASPAYIALAPSVLLVSVLAALRGWWQGHGNMFPTAVSQLIEQAVKLIAGLGFAALMMPHGVLYGVIGAALGITASELVALVAVGAGFLFMKKRTVSGELSRTSDLLSGIYKSALPISFGALVMPLIQLIDSVMIVNILVAGGMETSAATSLYGVAGAPVSALINLPTVLTAAAASALMPKFAAAVNDEEKKRLTGRGMACACFVGICGAAALALFASDLVSLLYGGFTEDQTAVAVSVLRLSSPGVIYVCIMQIVTTRLQSEGRAHVPAVNLLVGGAVKASLTALLLMTVGIEGSAIAGVVAYTVTLALDLAAAGDMRGLSARPLLVSLSAVVVGSAIMLPLSFLPLSGIMLFAVKGISFALVCIATAGAAYSSRMGRKARISEN